MKKIFKYLPVIFAAFMGCLILAGCNDDDDKPVSPESLPEQATLFLKQYFPAANIMSSEKDKHDYEVMLSDGTRVEFSLNGEWTDVDAPNGKTIPSGFYPSAIDSYIETNFAGSGINEISKEQLGYDVELVDGNDLLFDYEGGFLRFD